MELSKNSHDYLQKSQSCLVDKNYEEVLKNSIRGVQIAQNPEIVIKFFDLVVKSEIERKNLSSRSKKKLADDEDFIKDVTPIISQLMNLSTSPRILLDVAKKLKSAGFLKEAQNAARKALLNAQGRNQIFPAFFFDIILINKIF